MGYHGALCAASQIREFAANIRQRVESDLGFA
jgi:hypothetical protein